MEEHMELEQRYIDALEDQGWSVESYTDDGRVEIGKCSPAGEDFNICVDVDGIADAVAEYAADFDTEEHIRMWIEANASGVGGVPSIKALVEDADAIREMLDELADALKKADERAETGTMGKDEFRQWIYDNYNVPGDNCTMAPAMLDGILDYADGMDGEQRLDLFKAVFPSLPEDIIRRVDY